MKKLLLAFTVPSIAVVTVGASAMMVSPTACGCQSSAQVAAMAAGIDADWNEAAELDAAQIEVGLRRHFVGRNPDPRELFPSKAFGCTEPSSKTVECFVETNHSWLLAKGWLITLDRAPNGTVVNARVSNTWRHRPNNSFKPTPLRGAA